MENYRGMEVIVIIVTFNGMPWIKHCLDSCRAYPVLVIDNASEDDTVSLVKSNFKEVTLIESKTNLGFGQANNLGISKALQWGYDRIFLLNQDAYLLSGSLDGLIRMQKANPKYGVLSPIHLNGSGEGYDRQFFQNIKAQNSFLPKEVKMLKGLEHIESVHFVNAAGWLLDMDCVRKVGGFDPIFFHYGEDNNYCQRVLFHGWKIGVFAGSQILHDRGYRPKPQILFGSDLYFKRLERRYKVKFGNVNISLDEMDKLSFKRVKSLFGALCKLQFKRIPDLMKELKILIELRPVLKQSRTLNMKRAPNYLKP